MTTTAAAREQARIRREHFMLLHWLRFPESRAWDKDDWVRRLKAEGLLSPQTNAVDCPSITRLWLEMKHVK